MIRSHRMRGTLRILALTVLVLVTAACTKSHDDTGLEATTTAPPRTTTTPEQAAEAAVRQVAEAWSRAATRLAASPDPTDAALSRYLTGDFLSGTVQSQQDRARKHLTSRPANPDRHLYRIDSISIHGENAVLNECVVNDFVLLDAKTGKILDDSVATRNVQTSAKRISAIWKLSERTTLKEWNGVAGCAVDT
jgi:hypothetical protein